MKSTNFPVDYKKILKKELSKSEKEFKNYRQILKEIIPDAAKILELHVSDKTTICSKLQLIFKDFPSREVRRYCPSEYKKGYPNKESREFLKCINEFSSITKEMQENLKIVGNDFKKMSKKNKRYFEKKIKKEFFSRNAGKYKKISELDKVLIHMLSFENTNGQIAKKFNISTKRVYQILRDKSSIKLAEKIWESDPRYRPTLKWYKDNLKRKEKNLPPIPISKL